MDGEVKKDELQSPSAEQSQQQQSIAETNPFLRTVAELIHRGRNRRTFAKPRH